MEHGAIAHRREGRVRALRWLRRVVAVVGGAAALIAAFGSPPPRASLRGGNPLATLAHDAQDDQPLIGRVTERLRAGSYAYLAVQPDDASEPRWAVALGAGAPPGTRVRVRSLGHQSDFHSARLDRTFTDLTFGIVSRLD
ncbi:MAG: hypothetical protein ABW252_22825 [Polyangiales bacterium]